MLLIVEVKAVADEVDKAAFGVGELVGVFDGHAIGQFDAVVTDGNDVKAKAFVAE